MQIQSNAAFYIVSFSGQEMFSEINFSLFLPLQNSNVVYLETFCANTVSGDGAALHLAAFSRNKENLCLFTVCPLAPLQTDSCTLQYNIVKRELHGIPLVYELLNRTPGILTFSHLQS